MNGKDWSGVDAVIEVLVKLEESRENRTLSEAEAFRLERLQDEMEINDLWVVIHQLREARKAAAEAAMQLTLTRAKRVA